MMKALSKKMMEQNNENTRSPPWICRHMAAETIRVFWYRGTWVPNMLIQNPKCVDWASSEDNRSPRFWVCVSVGCGKSSLVSRIIEWHLEKFLFDQLTQVGYFYCSRTRREAQGPGTTPETVMSSLVSQLSWSPDGLGIVKRFSDFYATYLSDPRGQMRQDCLWRSSKNSWRSSKFLCTNNNHH